MAETGGPSPCRACGFSNRDGARFCGACGVALDPLECPGCGAENPREHVFCDSCGAPLDAAAPAAGDRAGAVGAGDLHPRAPAELARRAREAAAGLAGERKQVTVLFADVTGSMELAEGVDPERWRAIMDHLFRLLADAVHRFEGTVDKFTGDGIMAIFGAPIAHEDHAQRACYAALDMQRGVSEYAAELRRAEGLNLGARIGINSGEVVVGAIGEDLSLSYTAVGHTVGLAQRMEAIAEPGSVYATEHTASLAAGFLELRDLGSFEVKGSSRSLRVYEVAGLGSARGRLDVSRRASGLARLVGRELELRELEQALEEARAGDGRVVGVVAEAGVGKSRLCAELVERARSRGISEVHVAHCQAHMRNLPLVPVLQMLRSYFRVEDRDSPGEAREKIAGRMLALDPGLADDLSLVFDFLGVADPERPVARMQAEARRRRLLAVLGRLVGGRGREGPGVLVVEDAHWIDPASEEFLAALCEGAARTQTLVLVNFRPEFQASWMERPWYRELALEALAGPAVAELVRELLGSDPSLDGLSEMIRERTGGNPFFIEELVRELAESGALEGERGAYRLERQIDSPAIPLTVQSILAARIDRLGAEAKRVLGAAAVVGRSFRRELAARAAGVEGERLDAALATLIEAEFIAETELHPEPAYSFRHPLTREVALASQLAARRRAIHRRVAAAIEELEPERLDERAALIAQHYDEAGDALDAARWYLRAAFWSRTNDQPATLANLERIRELDPELPGDAEADGLRAISRAFLLGIGWRAAMPGERMLELFEEGREVAERTGNDVALVTLHASAAVALTVMGDAREGVRFAEHAITVAGRSDDRATGAMARAAACYPLFLTGALERALETAAGLIESTADDPMLGGGLGAESPHAWAVCFRGVPLGLAGRFPEALEALEAGERVSRRLELGETLGWAHAFRVGYEHWSGGRDGDLALVHGRGSLEIAESIGGAFSLVVALAWLGEAHRIAAEPERALEWLERALEIIESSGSGLDFEVYSRWLYAHALTDAGDFERAIDEAARDAALGVERGVRVIEPGARIAGARARIARAEGDDLRRAERLIDEAEALAAGFGGRAYELQAADCRAALAAARGQGEARRAALEAGLERARGLRAPGWEARFTDALAASAPPTRHA